jgi:hypothetical protein
LKTPTTMMSRTIASLMATITAVTRDDSLMPSTSTAVMARAMRIAGMLNRAVSPATDSGRVIPMSLSPWAR